jgi:hypothetical protein
MSGTQYGFDASVFFADFESENLAVKRGGPVDAGDGQEAHDGAFDPLDVAVIELGFQRAPAGRAVLTRHRNLGRRNPASGMVRRSSAKRSFASFLRYSRDARSGSFESGY